MTGPSLRELALASLLFGVLALATHGGVINNGYAFDAFYTVRDNPQVETDATLAEIFTSSYWDAERFPGRGLYRPKGRACPAPWWSRRSSSERPEALPVSGDIRSCCILT